MARTLKRLQMSAGISFAILGAALIVSKIWAGGADLTITFLGALLLIPLLAGIMSSLSAPGLRKGAGLYDLLKRGEERVQTSLHLLKGGMRGSVWLSTLIESRKRIEETPLSKIALRERFPPFFTLSLLFLSSAMLFEILPLNIHEKRDLSRPEMERDDPLERIETFLDRAEEFALKRGKMELLDAIRRLEKDIKEVKGGRIPTPRENISEQKAKIEGEGISRVGHEGSKGQGMKDFIARMVRGEIRRAADLMKASSALKMESSTFVANRSLLREALAGKIEDVFKERVFEKVGGKGGLWEKVKESAHFLKSKETIDGAVEEALRASISEFIDAFSSMLAEEIEKEIGAKLEKGWKTQSLSKGGRGNGRLEKVDFGRESGFHENPGADTPSFNPMIVGVKGGEGKKGKPLADGSAGPEATQKGGMGAGKGLSEGGGPEGEEGAGTGGLNSEGKIVKMMGLLNRKREEERLDEIERYAMERVITSDFYQVLSGAEEGMLSLLHEDGIPPDYLQAVLKYFDSLGEDGIPSLAPP